MSREIAEFAMASLVDAKAAATTVSIWAAVVAATCFMASGVYKTRRSTWKRREGKHGQNAR